MAFWSLPSGNPVFFALTLAVIGFFAVPILPISFAFAVELTYPTPEPMSNGMMLLPTKILGALLAVAAGHLCSVDPYYALGLFLINALVTTAAAVMIKEELRRLSMKR